MPLPQLKELLDNNHVNYVSILHGKAYTAQELAHTMHIPGKEFVKCVITHDSKGKHYLVAIPADHKLNLNKLAKVVKVDKMELETEQGFGALFPQTELGAMPPFGTLFNMNTIVDEDLTKDKEIVFNAGNHSEAIRMKFDDFKELEHPIIGKVTDHMN